MVLYEQFQKIAPPSCLLVHVSLEVNSSDFLLNWLPKLYQPSPIPTHLLNFVHSTNTSLCTKFDHTLIYNSINLSRFDPVNLPNSTFETRAMMPSNHQILDYHRECTSTISSRRDRNRQIEQAENLMIHRFINKSHSDRAADSERLRKKQPVDDSRLQRKYWKLDGMLPSFDPHVPYAYRLQELQRMFCGRSKDCKRCMVSYPFPEGDSSLTNA